MRTVWGTLVWIAGVIGQAAADQEIAGRVVAVDGKPARGVTVVLVEEGQVLKLVNGRLGSDDRAPRAETDADGRFRLPGPAARHALFAMDRQGYAVRNVGEPAGAHGLVLRPWGRIEGTIRRGARPDPKRSVSLESTWNEGRMTVADSREFRSDARGRFTLERVLPGLAIVAQVNPWADGMKSDLHWIDVESGKTTEVAIGGVGRPVEGRVAFPRGVPAPHFESGRAILFRKLPPLPYPPEWAAWDGVRKQAWLKGWAKTPAGSAHMRNQNRYSAAVTPMGTFRFEDVPPGSFGLILNLFQRLPDAPEGSPPRIVGKAVREVELPPIPGGKIRSDIPHRLDATEVTVAATAPGVGEQAPDFAIKTLDDKPLRLSDFRGRYVLLDFWATWCVPCARELPHLRAIAVSGGDRLAVIGLNLDTRRDPARKYAEAQGMTWTQGYLGEWSNSPVAASYDVQGIPSIWLIGPDGRVVARDLHGPAIRAAVADALGRR